MERIPTGIEEFDKMIEGGFKKSDIMLLSGGAGSGKTTFAFEFLYNGTKSGEKGLYLSFEEDPDSIKENMRRYGFDADGQEQQGNLEIMKVNAEDALRLVDEDYGAIHDAIKRTGASRIVLDSLGAFELLVQDGYKTRKCIANLVNWFRARKCTTIITAEAEQNQVSYSKHGIVEFLVDGVIVLYNIRRGNLRRRALEIVKMRGTKHETKIVSFVFNKGIQLLPKEDVFD